MFFQRIRKLNYPFKTSYETTPTVKLSSAVLKSRLRPRGIWLRLDKNTVTILNGVISRHFLDFVGAIVQFASCSPQFPCVTLQNRLSINWWSKADRFSTTMKGQRAYCKFKLYFLTLAVQVLIATGSNYQEMRCESKKTQLSSCELIFKKQKVPLQLIYESGQISEICYFTVFPRAYAT